MKVTEISVTAARTISHPREQYSNFKPEIFVKATIESGDDYVKAASELQAQAENLVDHVAKQWIEQQLGSNQAKPNNQPPANRPQPEQPPAENKPAGEPPKKNTSTKPASAAQIKVINDYLNRKKLSADAREKWLAHFVYEAYGIIALEVLKSCEASELIDKLFQKKCTGCGNKFNQKELKKVNNGLFCKKCGGGE